MSEMLASKQKQSKEIMIFILVMSLSGLENLIAEIIPELQFGPVELGISSFIFVPIVLCLLFNSYWAALAAPLGEIIFADLPLGEFGGFGEFEEVFILTIALVIGAKLIKDMTNRRQITIATLAVVLFEGLTSMMIDIGKVWIGIEELEAVAGLPESIVIIEGLDFIIEFAITGVIFGLIPTLYFLPKLYGRIEPLLGIKPREKMSHLQLGEVFNGKVILGIVFATAIGVAIAFLSEMGFNFGEWEPEFLDQFGEMFMLVPIVLCLVVFGGVMLYLNKKNKKNDDGTSSRIA